MRTCLVVDDSSVIRKVARRILEGLDFQIVEAEDGEKALDICTRAMWATSFSVVLNTTLGASPPGMRRRLPRNS